jgi:predicted TIM-barrel fold metal-dependent hydrolase
VDLAGGYDRWRAVTLDLLASLSSAEREAVLGGNATRVYGVRDGDPVGPPSSR